MSGIAEPSAADEPVLPRGAERLPKPVIAPLWTLSGRPIDRWRANPPNLLLLLVSIFLALQFVIPAELVIGGLGAAGRPSAVVALFLGLAWVASWLSTGALPPARQPVRWIILAFFTTAVLSYAAGYARGLPAVEASSASRHLILVLAMCGLTLAVADGVRDRETLDTMLRRLTYFSGVMAAFGVIQALFYVNLAAYIRVPGLQANSDLIGIGERGDEDFARVAGTANHFIEFGVVLAMVTPIAIHYAMHSVSRAQRFRRWALLLLIVTSIPLSISRSAIVSLAVALGVLAVVWNWRTRGFGAVAAILATAAFSVLQPGVLGTIRSLFANSEDDPSVQNRISDYPVVRAYFAERPVLGRGLATFLPDEYILLDNQLLYTLVTTGALGLAAFALLFVGGSLVARSVRHRGCDDEARHLGQALVASLLAGLVASATFDSMSFVTFVGVLFLCLGAVGALYRLTRLGTGQTVTPAAGAPPAPGVVAPSLGVRWRTILGSAPRGGPRSTRSSGHRP